MFKKIKNARVKTRLINERYELGLKLIKLYKYLKKEDAKQRDLLEEQAAIMEDYYDILSERLKTWEDD